MNDSLTILKMMDVLALDTLRIVQLSNDGWWKKFLGIATIIITPSVGLIGYWLGHYLSGKQLKDQQQRQDRAETNREMLKHRLEIYRKAAEMLSHAYSSKFDGRTEGDLARQFPYAYQSWEGAKNWMNDVVAFFDEHRFLFDKDSYKAFQALNRMVLDQHLQTAGRKGINNRDEELKVLGSRDINTIQDHVNAIYKAMQTYLNGKYAIDLEIPEVT
jgi:hypothetical protein